MSNNPVAGWLRTVLPNPANTLLWTLYLLLLGVLLPNSAWAFGQFEPEHTRWLGWVAAGVFEGAIAVLTWRQKQAIESAPNTRKWRLRLWRRYGTVYTAGLLLAFVVSTVANWSHAEEFGQAFAVFARYGIPPILYSVAFGGILPTCSLLFARILADVQDAEAETDVELVRAKQELADLRRQLREQGQALATAEARFAAAGDLFVRLTAESKRNRILAVVERWPQLPSSAVAIITESSASYVSEVLSER